MAFYAQREEVRTGTTLVAIETADGVVVGTDSRTTAGQYISSRATDKITVLTDHIVMLRSGSASDSQAIADIVMYYAESESISEDEPVTVNRVSQITRKFCYNYREQLEISIIVAGYDAQKKGQIYVVPKGGYTVRQPIFAAGSGSVFIMGYLDQNWHERMSMEEGKELVKNAVFLAQHRDGSSGGVINLASIDKNGTRKQVIRPDKPGYPKLIDKILTDV